MRNGFSPTVYILASKRNGTLYTGVASDPIGRLHQHRNGSFDGFTRRYCVRMLVWFELHSTMQSAILREKRIKKWESPMEARTDRSEQSGMARSRRRRWLRSASVISTRFSRE